MPQAWDRQKMGLAGLEEDVKAVYDFVRNELANHRSWVLNTIQGMENKMADYTQAAQDAETALDGLVAKVGDLSTQLKTAVANSDMSAVQAVADQLEQHAQAASAALNPPAAATPPADTTTPTAPADQTVTPTPVDPTTGTAPTDTTTVTPVDPGTTPPPADATPTPADTPAPAPAGTDPVPPTDPTQSPSV